MPSGVRHAGPVSASEGAAASAKATLAKSGIRVMTALIYTRTAFQILTRIKPAPPPPFRARTPPAGQKLSRPLGAAGALHRGRGAAGRLGVAATSQGALRVPALRREAGLGVPVRRRHGGADRRDAPLVS